MTQLDLLDLARLAESTMLCNVNFYWTKLKKMGASYENIIPDICQRGYGRLDSDRDSHWDHSYDSEGPLGCFGDFDIINKARAILKRYGYDSV